MRGKDMFVTDMYGGIEELRGRPRAPSAGWGDRVI